MGLVEETAARIGPPDAAARESAARRHTRLTKPPGSLGRLEELGIWLAGIQGQERPAIARRTLLLAAADHGVAARGVSAYPAEVTGQMVRNFAAGGAAANVLARHAGARVLIVDAGVASPIADVEGIVRRSHGPGTADLSTEPAMSRDVAVACLEAGIALVEAEVTGRCDLLALGEMGIGNTTSAACIAAAFTGLPAAVVTGRGTGVSAERHAHKVVVVKRALVLHAPDPADPIGVLAAVGGFEIGVLAGAILGAAAARIPIVLDGFITNAAALIAVGLARESREYLVASHRSAEPGAAAALDQLGLEPLLDLRLRLGEGSGALLALPLLEAAARVLDEMATFDEAGVSDAEEPPRPSD